MQTRAERAQALADALSAATGLTAEQHVSEDAVRVEVSIPAGAPLTSQQWAQLGALLGALPLTDHYGNRRLQDGQVLVQAELRDAPAPASVYSTQCDWGSA